MIHLSSSLFFFFGSGGGREGVGGFWGVEREEEEKEREGETKERGRKSREGTDDPSNPLVYVYTEAPKQRTKRLHSSSWLKAPS